MSDVFRTRRRVEWSDTDAAGIAHFTCFLRMMEQAEHDFLRSRDLSVHMTDAEGPISWPRVSVRCDFRVPVRFEDELDIDVHIDRLGTKSVTYAFRFQRDGQDIADGSITTVCCRLPRDGSSDPPQSIEVPEAIAAKLRGASTS